MERRYVAGIVLCLALLVGLAGFTVVRLRQSSGFLKTAPRHGASYLLALEPGADGGFSNLIERLAEAERKRFAKLGVQIYWESPGSNLIRIVAAVDGADQLERARRLVALPGRLELRLVHPESDTLVLQGLDEAGFEVLASPHKSKDGRDVSGFLVQKKPEVTGDYINNAAVTTDLNGRPEISFSLNPDGAAIFARITERNVGRQLAIVLDGKLRSAPIIKDAITGGNVQITGNYAEAEVRELADVLDCPLPVPVKILDATSF
jgi:SecD/SecF fusion protein